MRILCHLILFLFSTCSGRAQIGYTANDFVKNYPGYFRYGVNFGYYPLSDEALADISAGNENLGIPGAGVKAIRPALPDHFLEYWGFNIRVNTFAHYDSIGLKDNVAFIGYPSNDHRDKTAYCPGDTSALFAGMFTPIWDGGANGTPVNEENHYALYLYKMVSLYKPYVKFWEVWNEPDLDHSGNGWKPKGMAGNWWENEPSPCEYAIKAPISHYVRLLRISYEVIKSLDPDAYVAIGGLGYPSFLDAVLRNTDNPDGGSVSFNYPLKGGAYFDVMSYHSYPHIDGSLRTWSNLINGFDYSRHSDAAVDGLIKKKSDFEEVLRDRGYDGSQYPSKLWIVTESNIPRKEFGEYIGTDHAQRNYAIKSLIECQMNRILQLHIFALAENANEGEANTEFATMGLYEKLNASEPGNQKLTESGIAFKTTSNLLFQKKFDLAKTKLLHLPNGIKGGAFKGEDGQFTYVLWAETKTDRSETASASYDFPADLGIKFLEARRWDFSKTNRFSIIGSAHLQLTGDPIFLSPTDPASNTFINPNAGDFYVYPNPNSGSLKVQFELDNTALISLSLLDSKGSLLRKYREQVVFEKGFYELEFSMFGIPDGVYYLKTVVDKKVKYQKILFVATK